MLARKISASSGTSAGSSGRMARFGWGWAFMTPNSRQMPRRHARACRGHPRLCGLAVKQVVDGRDKPGHDDTGSSRDLPGGAVLGVFQNDAHGGEFVADAVRLVKIFGLARLQATQNFLIYAFDYS